MSRVDELMELIFEHGTAQYNLGRAHGVPNSTEASEHAEESTRLESELRTALSACVAEWRPISEAPRDGTPVLVWCPEKMLGSHVQAAVFKPNVSTIGGLMSFDVKHPPVYFMPQPQPPETP